MARREYTLHKGCAEPGCGERTFGVYDTQREYREAAARQADKPWHCQRHASPGRNLRPDNTATRAVLVATTKRRDGRLIGRFWVPEGNTLASGSGFNHSAAHTAFAEDFPEGTRLVVTATIEPPVADEPEGGAQ